MSVAFPVFPRTPHLPGALAASADDLVAGPEALQLIMPTGNRLVCFEEKLDGANARVCFDGRGEPIIGNRDKILNKGYVRKSTPAKIQFRSFFTWVYDHRKEFEALARYYDEPPVVYGEWLYATHTIHYDSLPALFIPFDLWVPRGIGYCFEAPGEARLRLTEAGFCVPPLLPGLEIGKSAWGLERAEGIYIKVQDGLFSQQHRYKLVRADFKPREDFNTTPLQKNSTRS